VQGENKLLAQAVVPSREGPVPASSSEPAPEAQPVPALRKLEGRRRMVTPSAKPGTEPGLKREGLPIPPQHSRPTAMSADQEATSGVAR
jgi:hypothetical protein